MLKRIRYTNFKSWEDTGDIPLGSISGFFGTNSSGKTSLLQGLLMLKQTAESSDRNLVLDFGNEDKYTNLGSMREAIFAHRAGKMGFEIDWQLPETLKIDNPEQAGELLFSGKAMAFRTVIEFIEKKPIKVERIEYALDEHQFYYFKKNGEELRLEYEGAQQKNFKFKRQDGRKWTLPAPVRFYGFPDKVFYYFRNSSFLSDFQLELERQLQRLYYLGPLREYPKRTYSWRGGKPTIGSRGENVIEALIESDQSGRKMQRGYKQHHWAIGKYVAWWLSKLGLIHSFEIRELKSGSGFFEVWVRKTTESSEVLITDVGFGVSQILPVIALCYLVPAGSTLLIEQPEIHLHPRVQAGLADVFIDAVKKNGVQIILESHSEHLLRRLQLRLAEEQISPDDLNLYFCESKNGHSELQPLELDEFGTIKNWPKDFFGDEMGELAAINLAKIKRLQNQ